MTNRIKSLLSTIILAVLLASTFYASIIHSAQAAEISTQQKALVIMNDVIGFDLTKYASNLQDSPQTPYLGVVPQENLHYTLQSNGTEVDLRLAFANQKLRMIHVLENTSSVLLTKRAPNTLEMAKDFLNSYQDYSNNLFYGQLNSMLSTLDVGKNITKTSWNVKLEVTISEDYETETYSWIYTCNGVEAPSKCVKIGYADGFLKYFVDNWDLYQIGSTSLNISETQAVDFGIQRARAFSWEMGSGNTQYVVKNFTVANAMVWETVFLSNLYADNPRGEDPLRLYPIRHVWVSLDKFYPGNVYGLNVYVWADTGEIAYIHERVSSLDPPSDLVASSNDYSVDLVNDKPTLVTSQASMSIVSPILLSALTVALIFGVVPVLFLLGKKKGMVKCSTKTGGLLLCLLISSSIVLIQTPAVDASSPRERAEVWGSESSGDTSFNGASGRKTADEIACQETVSYLIDLYFSDYGKGYESDNNQGEDSLKSYILDDISENEAEYARVAVIDFDHGVGRTDYMGLDEFHFMFEDNVGQVSGVGANGNDPNNWVNTNMVYDMDIFPRTAMGKVFFAFINTCESANLTEPSYGMSWQGLLPGSDRARGMPFAWTHHIVKYRNDVDFNSAIHMSNNGYALPDDGEFVYLGFPFGSASLNQTIEGSGPQYWEWVRDFFWYALTSDQSVNDALDDASLDHYGGAFGETALATDFMAIWPMWTNVSGTMQWQNTTGDNSKLAVYGNGEIRLYQNGGIWSFDEGQGSTAYDSTAHHNDGTIYGPSWVDGRIGSALSFVDDDEVDVPSVEGLKYKGGDMTISAWVKADVEDSTRGFIISKPFNAMGVYNYRISWDSDDKITIHFNGGSQYYEYTTSSAYSEGVYHHIAVVLRSDRSVKLYVDGALVNSGTHSITSWNGGEYGDLDKALTFGNIYPQEPAYSSFMFNGDIDEIQIYDRDLSEDEIAVSYAANLPYYWVSMWADNDYGQYYQVFPWYKIDGQLAGYRYLVQGEHTVEAETWVYDPQYGYFGFDHFIYGGTTDYNNPATLQLEEHTPVTAYYIYYGW